MSEWLDLQCGLCRTKLRIRAAYAHMKGRCPDCGFRIPPPRPLPTSEQGNRAAPLTSDEPLGLLPEEEEWPEPALHAEPESFEGVYNVTGLAPAANAPVRPESMPGAVPEAKSDSEVFRLVDGPKPSPPQPSVKQQPPPVRKPELPPLPEVEPPASSFDPLFLDELELAPPLPPEARLQPVDPLADVPPAKPKAAEPAVITPYSFSGGEPLPLPMPPAGPPPVATFAEPPTPDAQANKPKKRKKQAEGKPGESPKASIGDATSSGGGSAPSAAAFSTYELNDAELNPKREAPPPDFVYFSGVWNTPWAWGNLRAWIWPAIGLTTLHWQLLLILSVLGSQLGTVVAGLVGLGMVWVAVLTGSYMAACFLSVIADTANGSPELSWPDGGWKDWFFSFLYLAWLMIVAGFPAALLASLGMPPIVVALAFLFVFPAVVLCSLANSAFLLPFNSKVMAAITLKATYYITGWFLAALMWGAIVLAVEYGLNWLTAPLLGLAQSAAWLIYARLIGRLGWVLNWDGSRPKKKKKRKKAERAAGEPSTDQPEEDEDEVEATQAGPGWGGPEPRRP